MTRPRGSRRTAAGRPVVRRLLWAHEDRRHLEDREQDVRPHRWEAACAIASRGRRRRLDLCSGVGLFEGSDALIVRRPIAINRRLVLVLRELALAYHANVNDPLRHSSKIRLLALCDQMVEVDVIAPSGGGGSPSGGRRHAGFRRNEMASGCIIVSPFERGCSVFTPITPPMAALVSSLSTIAR